MNIAIRNTHFAILILMLKNYFKIAWRNLFKNKGFSLINITGLAIGMASAILILLWIQNELSYDQFHEKKDRLYVMYNRAVFDGKLWCWNTTPKILGPTVKMSYPQAEDVARINRTNFLFTVGDKHLNVQGDFTDPGFLTMFSFPLEKGNPKTALNTVHTMVITQKLAKKLFGDADPMGKVVKIDSVARFTVSGVMKDLPNNTDFDFEYLMPWSYMEELKQNDKNWGNNSVQNYVLLKPGVKEAQANKAFLNITRSHSDVKDIDQFLHPISKWRLYSKFENGKNVGGRIEIVKLFGIIAGFILLIACINFMNLSTARSEKRAREVGIRKVAGAPKGLLVAQFLGESVLIAFFAGVFALIVVQLSLNGFNHLTEKQLFIPYTNLTFWLSGLGFVFFTGIIAGSYPAFYLSSYKPISVLKGTFKAANALVTPRKILVVLQFTFAIVLIICTIIVQRQINFAQSRDTGYDRSNLGYVFMTGETEKHYTSIKNDLLASGAVSGVTKTNSPITQQWSDSWDYTWVGKKDPNEKLDFIIFNTDGDFVKTVGAKLIAGRDIDLKAFPGDSTAMLLNEAAVKVMGFKNAVGQIVKGQGEKWTVVGVVKDFILNSPYEPVRPMVLHGPKSWFSIINFKLNTQNSTVENLKKISAVFKKYNPEYPFEVNFADEGYAKKFRDEKRIGTLAGLFAGLTIVISCLGLFALATYMAENRIKEIGVRKVLGASVGGLTTLLSKDFLKLVLVAFAIASPIAWWGMHTWLQGYTYRVDIGWTVFVLTGLLSVFIAVATVSYQAVKAALANPVKSLRTE